MKNVATLIAAGLLLVGCKDQGNEKSKMKDSLAENNAEMSQMPTQGTMGLEIEPQLSLNGEIKSFTQIQ